MLYDEQSPDRIFDIQEASVFTKLKPPTLRKKSQENEIPHMKVGRRVLFSRNALLDWLKQHSVHSTR